MQDSDAFIHFLRIEPEMFEEILEKIGDRIQHYVMNFRPSLSPAYCLAICLEFLVIGDMFRSLSFLFSVAHNTISKIVEEVCETIIEEYHEKVMPADLSVDDWRMIKFEKRWNFPHASVLWMRNMWPSFNPRRVIHCSSTTRNFSALCCWQCLMLNINSSSLTLSLQHQMHRFGNAPTSSSMLRYVEAGHANWPAPDSLPNDGPTPYFLVGDDAFPLNEWMMKPYSMNG